MPRAYAILFKMENEDTGYLYFPIKLPNHPNHGGMPQFFGGDRIGNETDRQTIAREMLEESNNRIVLGEGRLKKIHHAIVNGEHYNFYCTQNFSPKPSLFLGDMNGNPEMASIQRFFVQRGNSVGVEDMLNRLNITGSADFTNSETYTAFDNVLRNLSEINAQAHSLIFSKEMRSSKEPVLLNGMKVIFDEEVPVQPVTLRDTDNSRLVEERSPEPPRFTSNRYQDHPRYTTARPDPLLRYRRPKKINL